MKAAYIRKAFRKLNLKNVVVYKDLLELGDKIHSEDKEKPKTILCLQKLLQLVTVLHLNYSLNSEITKVLFSK